MSSGHYETGDDAFDHKHGVLRNISGLTTNAEIAAVEFEGLLKAFDFAYSTYETDQLLGSTEICTLHQVFLGHLYGWAGSYRTVNMSSDGILWCAAPFIEQQMSAFDRLLADLTPFPQDLSVDDVSQRIAKIHAEQLIVIHPFREGNGRLTRLFCNVLLSQGWFEEVSENAFYDQRTRYFEAIRECYAKGSNQLLTAIYRELL